MPFEHAQPRKRRRAWNEPGHAHELTFSCYRRLPLLSKDRSRHWFIEALGRARQRRQFELWAYVIMPEHVHVLLYPKASQYDMAAILKSIKQPVARRAIRYLRQNAQDFLDQLRVTRAGRGEWRFWQEGGGYDRNIFEENVAWTCVDYMHHNPVRRGLVEHPLDWPWSSARWYAELANVKLEMDDCPPWPSPSRTGRARHRQ